MANKPRPKPKPKGTGSVTFEVQPNVYRYLTRLTKRSAIGGTENEVARHLFTAEVLRAMRTREYEVDDPENSERGPAAVDPSHAEQKS